MCFSSPICCSPDRPCTQGEGHCRSDADCAEGLFCGTNNCHHANGQKKWAKWAFTWLDDCCTDTGYTGFWNYIGKRK